MQLLGWLTEECCERMNTLVGTLSRQVAYHFHTLSGQSLFPNAFKYLGGIPTSNTTPQPKPDPP